MRVKLTRVWCLCAKHECGVELHVLEVGKLLLNVLGGLLDGLVGRLYHAKRATGEMGSGEILLVVIRRCYHGWV